MTNQQGRLRTRVAVFACVAAAALIVDQLTKLGRWPRYPTVRPFA